MFLFFLCFSFLRATQARRAKDEPSLHSVAAAGAAAAFSTPMVDSSTSTEISHLFFLKETKREREKKSEFFFFEVLVYLDPCEKGKNP